MHGFIDDGLWLVFDSGASFHMTNDKSLFSIFEEKDLKMRIEMGDDGKYRVSGEGMLCFRGSMELLSR